MSSENGTEAKTIWQYVELYSGDEAILHHRYAHLISTVFVAFTHGIALPILFPLTCFSIANQYYTEQLLYIYYYRKPPVNLCNKTNIKALRYLGYAPFLMIIFGYWQLGNRQIFYNERIPLSFASQKIQGQFDPGHQPIHVSDQLQFHHLFLFFAPIFLFRYATLKVLTTMYEFFRCRIKKLKC